MSIDTEHLSELATLIKQLCGVALDETKGYLIESRLEPLVRESGARDYIDLCRRAIAGDRRLKTRVIDAITTHETLFFRDGSPFQLLQHKIIPTLIDARGAALFGRRLRFWSAACSTGQEPYSLAITLHELIPDIAQWDIQILGTDVSEGAIETARKGWYSSYEIDRGMPPELRHRYFTPENGGWQVADKLRTLVRFDTRNLLDPFDDLGPFDVIMCRNVVIYFDPQTRRDVFFRIADRLAPDGYLIVGSAESLTDLGNRFTPQLHCHSIYYQPNQPRNAVAGT